MGNHPAFGWLCQLLFGTGAFWEWRKTPLVNLEIGRGLAELHQKKTTALEEILRPEMVTPQNSSYGEQRLIT